MDVKARGFYQCSVGWGTANREDKISALTSSSMCNVCQGEKFFQNSERIVFVDSVHRVMEGIRVLASALTKWGTVNCP